MNTYAVTDIEGNEKNVTSAKHEIFTDGTLVFWNVELNQDGNPKSQSQVAAYAPGQWRSFELVPEPPPAPLSKAEQKAADKEALAEEKAAAKKA